MTATRFDVLGIGNAIVDVIARTDDDFLVKQEHAQGRDGADRRGARGKRIYDAMGPAVEISGGSAANTIVGVAELRRARGLRRQGASDDELGRVFAHDIRAAGVTFDDAAGRRRALDRALLRPGHAGRRAHHEHLSRRRAEPASRRHRRRARSRRPRITYLEGYLWDPPHAKDAFLKAAKIAHDAGRDVALTLVGCVLRRPLARRVPRPDPHRHGRHPVRQRAELHSLYQTADFDTALAALRADAKLAVVTRSEKGCLVVTREETEACRPRRSSGWSTPPAPATCSRRASCSAWRAGRTTALRAARRAGGRRGDPASRRAAGDLAQGPGAGERLRSRRLKPGGLAPNGAFSAFFTRDLQQSTADLATPRNCRGGMLLCVRGGGNRHPEVLMDSLSNRLPDRFPVGTRYVIEGRREGDGDLRISLRCLEFPDGRQVRLPADRPGCPPPKRAAFTPGLQGGAANSRKSSTKIVR